MANNNERKLKIVPKYFPRRWQDAIFPEIRLAGKWLQDLGFTCGKSVTVRQEENKIIIMVVEEAQQEAPPVKKTAGRKAKIIPLDMTDIPINQLFRPHSPADQNTDSCNFDTIA